MDSPRGFTVISFLGVQFAEVVASTNDTDRLRKHLARFELNFPTVTALGK